MSDEVPEGWAEARLVDVAELVTGTTPPTKDAANYGGSIPFVKPGDLGRLEPITAAESYVTDKGAALGRMLRPGATLVCCIGSIGKAGFLGCEAITNQQINAAVPGPALDPRFLFHQLRSITAWLDERSSETTIRIVNKGRFGEAPILVPPLPEQRRIVSNVEALLARVNAARDRVEKVPLLLKRFRQAVFSAACSGELTTDWRESRRPVNSTRLPQLLKAHEELWRRRTRSVSEGARKQRYRPPFEPQPPEGMDLPEGWDWVTISHLACLDVGFAFKSVDFTADGIRLLRGENVEPGRLRWKDVKHISAARQSQFKSLLIEAGEVILAMDRPIVSAGLKLAVATKADLPALLVQRVMRFKPTCPGHSEWIHTCLSEARFLQYLGHHGMTGSDLPHITGTGVAEYTVQLPPVEEQVEILNRLKVLMARADAIERAASQARAVLERLPGAILKKAFSGELVPTEAELARVEGRAYESAGELLARLVASERSDAHGARRSGRKARAAGRMDVLLLNPRVRQA